MITSCVISTTEDEHEDELNLFKSQTRGADVRSGANELTCVPLIGHVIGHRCRMWDKRLKLIDGAVSRMCLCAVYVHLSVCPWTMLA